MLKSIAPLWVESFDFALCKKQWKHIVWIVEKILYSDKTTQQIRLMLILNYAVCDKKSRFIRPATLSKRDSNIVYYTIILIKFKMNKIVDKFLLYLRQPRFTW